MISQELAAEVVTVVEARKSQGQSVDWSAAGDFGRAIVVDLKPEEARAYCKRGARFFWAFEFQALFMRSEEAG